jgi:hypothetical protein
MVPIRFPETSVNDYHLTLRNIPEERRSHQHRVGSPKSHETSIFPKESSCKCGLLTLHMLKATLASDGVVKKRDPQIFRKSRLHFQILSAGGGGVT